MTKSKIESLIKMLKFCLTIKNKELLEVTIETIIDSLEELLQSK